MPRAACHVAGEFGVVPARFGHAADGGLFACRIVGDFRVAPSRFCPHVADGCVAASRLRGGASDGDLFASGRDTVLDTASVLPHLTAMLSRTSNLSSAASVRPASRRVIGTPIAARPANRAVKGTLAEDLWRNGAKPHLAQQ